MKKELEHSHSIKPWHLLFGAFFMFSGVILGAFGAHALKETLSIEQLQSYETGVRYQMYHGLAILLIAMKGHHFHLRFEKWIVSLFGVGIVMFSGSIYLLNLREVIGFNGSWLGPITPIGGFLLICAWALLFIEALIILSNRKR